MIAQRPQDAAPVVQGVAESLPFRDESFDAVLGVLTVHHWKDKEKGFSECRRVARSQVVFLTIDFDVCARFWLFDYFPELIVDRYIFPSIEQYSDSLESVELISIPIPADCRDGFLGAYWKRPRAYLDPLVRGSISTFSKIGNIDANLTRLESDIESGTWGRQYSSLQDLTAIDLGYRLVIARKPSEDNWSYSGFRVAKQHGHSVDVMLRMFAAWLEGATEADIHAIKKRWKKGPLRALHFSILEPQFPL
jgi:SAM-dependent methyltransferase